MVFVQKDGALGNGAGLLFKIDFHPVAEEHVAAGHEHHMPLGLGLHRAVVETHMIGRQPAIAFGNAHIALGHVALGAIIIADFIGGYLPGDLGIVLEPFIGVGYDVLAASTAAGQQKNRDEGDDGQCERASASETWSACRPMCLHAGVS